MYLESKNLIFRSLFYKIIFASMNKGYKNKKYNSRYNPEMSALLDLTFGVCKS